MIFLLTQLLHHSHRDIVYVMLSESSRDKCVNLACIFYTNNFDTWKHIFLVDVLFLCQLVRLHINWT